MPYRVQFTSTALKNMQRFPKSDQLRILERIEQLAADPQKMRNVKQLVNHDVAYRLRVGDYRVLFDRDDIIRIIDVGTYCPTAGRIGVIEMIDLNRVQVLKENGQAKFAVLPYADYEDLRELLSSEERLTAYLDYLHMQKVKKTATSRLTLDEVKAALDI